MTQQTMPPAQDALYEFSVRVAARTQRIAREYLALKDAEKAAVVAETLHVLIETLHQTIGAEPPKEPMSVRYVRNQRQTLLALDFEPETEER